MQRSATLRGNWAGQIRRAGGQSGASALATRCLQRDCQYRCVPVPGRVPKYFVWKNMAPLPGVTVEDKAKAGFL